MGDDPGAEAGPVPALLQEEAGEGFSYHYHFQQYQHYLHYQQYQHYYYCYNYKPKVNIKWCLHK